MIPYLIWVPFRYSKDMVLGKLFLNDGKWQFESSNRITVHLINSSIESL